MRPAWSSYWGSGLAALGVVLVWFAQRAFFSDLATEFDVPPELAAIGGAIALAPIILRVLYHRYTHAYEIENNRKLRTVAGFVSRVKREFPLTDKVQTDMGQTVLGRLLNFGTIAFWTGDDRSRLEWRNAPDPDRIIAFLDQLKSGGPTHAESEPARTAPPASDEPSGPRQNIPAPPSLKEAKATKYTHFGRAPDYKPLAEMTAKRIETPLGEYIDNDDGTVSHPSSGLMFLRAPWGMVWTGSNFVGDPLLLKWGEAADLFGRGANVGYNVGSSFAYFNYEKRAASAFSHGYKPGRCAVHAAGYKDWRLPTAGELNYFLPFIPSNSNDVCDARSGLSRDEQLDWSFHSAATKAMAARLYPELSRTGSYLWTATGVGSGLAWAYDGGLPVGDFKTDTRCAVLFVRKVTGGELAAPNLVDEAVSW